MKIFIPIFAFLMLVCLSATAQQVPLGMKYQAVARDLSGQILADKKINLQIDLVTDGRVKTTAYSETHAVVTNKLGLFTLNIGEGVATETSFSDVPWSSEEIWMEIKIQENEGEEFVTISNSKMLSVPYAFHAATASEFTGQSGTRGGGNSPGVPSQNWSLFGNSNSDPADDKLGTTDLADLVIVTNNIERMRVLEGGDIEIVNNVNIGKDLTVEENAYLNKTSGQTVNYGPFTVERMSPTALTGKLTVFNQQPTLLSGTLTVDLATDLNSSLNVDGITNLNSALNVNNNSPTLLTGTLEVVKNAVFHQQILVDNPALSSTSTTTGAVVIAGGLGIGENLNVGGASAFGGPVNFMSPVTISSGEESTNATSGALRVVGGVGIGKRLNVVGATALGNTLSVTGATTLSSTLGVTGATNLISSLTVGGASQLNNTLGVTGITTITNATSSSTTSNGALVVTGGAGIGGNLNIGGMTKLNGVLNLTANVANASGSNPVTATGNHVANFFNSNSDGNGISIKLGVGTPHNKNNFITFYNNGGGTVGRIEGENGNADYLRNQEYQDDIIFKSTAVAQVTLDAALTTAEEILAGTEIVAAATSSTACVGLGVCVTTPIPSIIVWTVAQLIVRTAQLILRVADVVVVTADLATFISTHKALKGITFASGSEDYAEYLSKADHNEVFMPGDIVGVKNGLISKNTLNADKIMVISLKPIVAGGLPQDEDVTNYELVAFMGQVPTRVYGKVNAGDYILPSGYNNGSGIAKHPKLMRAEDYKNILGVAWEENIGGGLGYVNVAIGLNTNDLADLVKQQADQIEDLKTQMRRNNIILADLVPGYAEAINLNQTDIVDDHAHEVHDGNETAASHVEHQLVDEMVDHAEGEIMYYQIERKHLEEGMKMAEEIMIEAYQRNGLSLDDHPFWQRIKSEPNYKEEIFANVNEEVKHAMHTHKMVNESIINQE